MNLQSQNPFSIYDFIGYFIPGVIFLVTLHLITDHALYAGNFFTFYTSSLDEGIKSYGSSYIVILIISAYLVGHFLSLLSAFTIERFAKIIFGTVTNRILKIEESTDCKCCFITCGIYLLLLPISIFERLLKPLINYLYYDSNDVDILVITLRAKSFDIMKNIAIISDQDPEEFFKKHNKSDYFKLIYHFVIEHTQYHKPKIHNYIALFGFNRNICFTAVLSFWVASYFLVAAGFPLYLFVACLVFILIANLTFIGYYKFYRRYVLEVLLAAAVTGKLPESICCHCPVEQSR